MALGEARRGGISRRTLLVGGGAGLGLAIAWGLWPRDYAPNLTAGEGEQLFGAWLKIGRDGQVTVAVPQAELGQGVYTALPQILADELGADWRTVAVEPAPLNPLYANPMAAEILFEDSLGALPEELRDRYVTRSALVLTAGSTSVRMFEGPLRDAGAAARVLLCKAAARRWGTDWQSCGTAGGFVVRGQDRLRFGELVDEAAGESLPEILPLRNDEADRLVNQPLPRLDVPAKVDGSATFAGDVRLPGMVFASIRQGPPGDTRLVRVDRAAADRIPGVLHVVETPRWVSAVASDWWAANRALDALAPRFETRGGLVSSAGIDAALDAAFDAPGKRVHSAGDLAAVFGGARVVTAEYRVGLALHAPLEPMTATAEFAGGRLRVWAPTQAPSIARAAAARAAGIAESAVVLFPMMAGGSFGAKLETLAIEQAAVLAKAVGKPVQLMWSRSEDCLHDRYRPPAVGRMAARLGSNGAIRGWQARIAAPATGREVTRRLLGDDATVAMALALPGAADPSAVAGGLPPYAIPDLAIDHHPAAIGVPTGEWRSGAHSYTAFFTESFIDELAHVANIEALSFRIAMLGQQARLVRCLSTVGTLGGWQGGIPGSGQGIACHSFRGSYIAVLAEARMEGARVRVDRLVAAVDCGRQVNPDLVLQQIEGGLMFAVAAATGGSTTMSAGLADTRALSQLGLPTLATMPEIVVEVIRSDADPGGVGELAVPAVAPAIGNALMAATGVRRRSLPLGAV
ncbi:xanthine dehydrogenase family protein molybdopterin-binding subunit [Sphingomonas japonica]|uniref:Isoquinoline 1-oxidoreductase beta subunit n=1 Tax=Sphingomonas japonica TaxID=511662 RepID=A0ABX0U399_9SPHN|nr:molybdopterin cofactor-binding domain-containing protein [Sphingomonas japonica]NIJ23252.1 isoquinoline 1-oxidoreductase beta subunit [Sphingomonas japonica]